MQASLATSHSDLVQTAEADPSVLLKTHEASHPTQL